MSDTPVSTPGPRRSQREKKTTKPFVTASSGSTNRKRKRHNSDVESNAPAVSDLEDAPADSSDDDGDADVVEEGYQGPKQKPSGSARKGKAKVSPKAKGASAVKKPRNAKPQGTVKSSKPTMRKGRRLKEGDNVYDADQVAKDTKISADNPLFNAIMNPAAALQSTAEDFLESLQQSPGAAQAELINLVLRSCGCNDSVNADETLDYDGVVDTLDNFTEALKQENTPIYPLTSKLPVFKKFKKSLSEFIERLISSSADLGALYTSDLMATLQTWVIAMSSSQIRSFRHTASVVALEVETALCDVAAAVEKEAVVVGRQREGERKRKTSSKSNAREKELEQKAQEIRERRTSLAEFIKEFVDGVFVHRYRDLDPNIRAECVRAIGLWFKKYPGHFLDASYLRYVGWVLSDSHTQVRLEAVRALSGVYEQVEYIGSLNHFTERFKPRLLEMAMGDTEIVVRVAVIQILGAIDSHSLLEDEEREKLCLLLFDEEARVRKAVSQFVRGVWEESVDERLGSRNKPNQIDKDRAGIKTLAMLLVKWEQALGTLVGDAEESDNGESQETNRESTSRPTKRAKEVIALTGLEYTGRMSMAVDALWDEVEPVKDWEGLLDFLLLDHSAREDDVDSPPRARANGQNGVDSIIDETLRLEEVEESILLEFLIASLRRAKSQAAGGKKGEEETVYSDITRALIKALPRLFIKHQTDKKRIAVVLLLPPLMNLDLYLEMRMITAYSSLWDDVIKQFISHSSLAVLTHAMAAIRHFMDATSLSNANSPKIVELEDELSSSLRDTVAGRDEIEVASFTEDEVLTLSALCTRLAVLAGTRNMTAWMEEDEGGKQSSAWDIINALVERGRLGYKEEETMIEQALHVLALHILWKGKGITAINNPSPDEIKYREILLEQRGSLIEKLVEYAIGTQSNTIEGVKRSAFKHLLDLHVLFSSPQFAAPEDSPLPSASVTISLDDEIQYRCAGYIQAEIEQYSETLEGQDEDNASNSDSDDDNVEDQGEKVAGDPMKAKRKGGLSRNTVESTSRARLEQEYAFMDTISTFLRAIRAGAVNIRHGAVLLTHYGRLGIAFDTCSKMIVDMLREEGLIKNNAEAVVSILTQALRESFNLVLDGVVRDEGNSSQLAKLLSTCFVIRGSQLSIVRRLESSYIIQVHTTMLSWIGKRLAICQKNKNKKSLKLAVTFFKVLMPLLTNIQSRDALQIKAHMDQILAEADIEVSATTRSWEPQRAYEKRLNAIMSKDKVGEGKPRKIGKSAVGASGITDAEESELSEVENNAPVPPRPRPRRITRANPDTSLIDTEDTADTANPDPVTPKARPKPQPVPVQIDPAAEDEEYTLPQSIAVSDSDSNLPPILAMTPKTARKRPRADEQDNDGAGGADDQHSDDTQSPGELQVRRKRVRH